MEFAHLQKSSINLHNTKIEMDKTGKHKIRAFFYNSPFTWTRGIPLQNREIFILLTETLKDGCKRRKKLLVGFGKKSRLGFKSLFKTPGVPKKSSVF